MKRRDIYIYCVCLFALLFVVVGVLRVGLVLFWGCCIMGGGGGVFLVCMLLLLLLFLLFVFLVGFVGLFCVWFLCCCFVLFLWLFLWLIFVGIFMLKMFDVFMYVHYECD